MTTKDTNLFLFSQGITIISVTYASNLHHINATFIHFITQRSKPHNLENFMAVEALIQIEKDKSADGKRKK